MVGGRDDRKFVGIGEFLNWQIIVLSNYVLASSLGESYLANNYWWQVCILGESVLANRRTILRPDRTVENPKIRGLRGGFTEARPKTGIACWLVVQFLVDIKFGCPRGGSVVASWEINYSL